MQFLQKYGWGEIPVEWDKGRVQTCALMCLLFYLLIPVDFLSKAGEILKMWSALKFLYDAGKVSPNSMSLTHVVLDALIKGVPTQLFMRFWFWGGEVRRIM